MKQAFLKIAIAAELICTGCDSPQKPRAAAKTPDPNAHAKIIAFYAREAVVPEGGSTVICYGLSNAKSVKIDPPVDGVWPALNRCVDIRPKGETRYTLTAKGSDGLEVSESFSVKTAVVETALPKITSFEIAGHDKDYAGKMVYQLNFAATNADEISIDPPVFPPLHGSPGGRFGVRPDKTTVYTLIAKGKNGHVARRQLTIEVP